MPEISERMKRCAYEFESAAIDAGFDYARMSWQAPKWALDEKQHLSIFAVDSGEKSYLWREGGQWQQ